MNSEYPFYVYILSSNSHELLIGFTDNLKLRIAEHRASTTRASRVFQLVHMEGFHDPLEALHRQAQLKAWPRARKHAFIDRFNPTWRDLAQDL